MARLFFANARLSSSAAEWPPPFLGRGWLCRSFFRKLRRRLRLGVNAIHQVVEHFTPNPMAVMLSETRDDLAADYLDRLQGLLPLV